MNIKNNKKTRKNKKNFFKGGGNGDNNNKAPEVDPELAAQPVAPGQGAAGQNAPPIPVQATNIIQSCITKFASPGEKSISQGNLGREFVECLVTDGKTMRELVAPEQPYFIVKYGPTGSGKGSKKVQDTIESLGLNSTNTATFEVDRIIESITEYIEGSMAIYDNYKGHNANNAAQQANLKKLSDLYMRIRQYKRANGSIINRNKQANHIQNSLINKALENGLHIVLETTGFSSIKWIPSLIQSQAGVHKDKYKIIVIYPLVKPETIKERVKSRGLKMVEERGLFRMPPSEMVDNIINKAKENLNIDITPMIEEGKIDRLILINNN